MNILKPKELTEAEETTLALLESQFKLIGRDLTESEDRIGREGSLSEKIRLAAELTREITAAEFRKQTAEAFEKLVISRLSGSLFFYGSSEYKEDHSADLEKKIEIIINIYENDSRIWRSVADHFPAGVFILDSHNRIKYSNSILAVMTGRDSAENLSGRSAGEIFWPNDPVACPVCRIIEQFRSEGNRSGIEETEIRDFSGRLIPVFLFIVPIRSESGEIIYRFGILQSRLEEFERRSVYLRRQLEPVIEKLESIAEKDISSHLNLSRTSEVLSLEEPVNRIVENLRSITGSVAEAADAAVKTSETFSRDIHKLQEWHTQTFEFRQNALAKNAANLISSLGKIEQMINLIQNIADQTNLLSLNASIVANKAGAQGKGFSVVASEVRSLASKSYEASSEITMIIDEIRRNTEEMNSHTAASAGESHNLEKNLTDMVRSLDGLESSIEKLKTRIGEFRR